LTGVDLKYLDVGDTFETYFLKQSLDENRNLEETLSRSWDVLANLPKGELTKIKDKNIQMYFKEGSKNIKQ
jgi:V/A-type H+/Na+-transporting ATPase subunit B